jgi:hypothetical protein
MRKPDFRKISLILPQKSGTVPLFSEISEKFRRSCRIGIWNYGKVKSEFSETFPKNHGFQKQKHGYPITTPNVSEKSKARHFGKLTEIWLRIHSITV